jgi:predicted ATP-grasp superfamily ATP-dependent carboligase
MLIFVYEWTACVPDAPPSLRREGWAMLWAVLDDFQKSRRVQTVTLVHQQFPHLPPGQVVHVRDSAEEEERFADLAGSADATLVIAPETSAVLQTRCDWVERAGGTLLGPTSRARRIASSKQQLGMLWQKCGVPTPPVLACGDDVRKLRQFPVVVKPDDGAGSQATVLVRNPEQLGEELRHSSNLIAQPLVPGQAASVAFLIGPRACIPLVPAVQHLSEDDHFQYLGGTMPLPSPLEKRAASLGRRAVQVCDGLRGYVGVDLVLGPAEDQDFAIEINPRLTTSYIGLRMLTRDNLAMAMARVALGEEVGQIRWLEQTVRFYPDGRLEIWPLCR